MSVRLVNESALGIYVMSWQSGPARKRAVITWCDGMPEPMLEFFVSGLNAMSKPVAIRNPERFGWRTPVTRASFKAFAQAFADQCESDVTS